MKTVVCLALSVAWLCAALQAADAGKSAFTAESVIIESFEAHDATLSDVLDALTILAETATAGAWRPSIVLANAEKNGARKITIKIGHKSLASAIEEAAKLAGLAATCSGPNILVGEKKG
jgi:hypothetical protein